jgi:hypothetical protein
VGDSCMDYFRKEYLVVRNSEGEGNVVQNKG